MLDDPSAGQVLRQLMTEVLAVRALGANPEDKIDAGLKRRESEQQPIKLPCFKT